MNEIDLVKHRTMQVQHFQLFLANFFFFRNKYFNLKLWSKETGDTTRNSFIPYERRIAGMIRLRQYDFNLDTF